MLSSETALISCQVNQFSYMLCRLYHSTAIYFSAIRIQNHRDRKFMEKLKDFHNGCYTVSVTWLPGQSYNKVENTRVVSLEKRIDKEKQHPSLSWAHAYRVSKFIQKSFIQSRTGFFCITDTNRINPNSNRDHVVVALEREKITEALI